MAVISLLFLAVMYVVHHPLMVSDRMDLDTLARSRQLEKRMSEEMRQLELEFEQRKRAAEEKQKAENFWRGDTSSDHSCDRTCSTSRPLIPAAMRRRRRSVACLSPPTTGLPTSPRGRCWNPFTNTTSRTSPGTCPAPVSSWRALWTTSSRPVGCSAAGRLTHSWRTAWASGLPSRNGEPSTRPRNLTSWCPLFPPRALCLCWR
ncbi:inositol 1,4,5-trisphosphate receptor-interacting protein-like 1 isoform 3-T4 [Megaptera novaeangliae]